MKPNNATWIISDTHFGHRNIIKYAQRPESHEVIMLDHWITRVREDDYLLHLGDVFLGKQGNPKRWSRVVSILPGRKFMIPGNHDNDKRLYRAAGFTILRPFIHNRIAFTHRPITDQFPVWWDEWDDPLKAHKLRGLLDPRHDEWDVNVHGHVHGNSLEDAAERHGEAHPLHGKRYINACVEVHDFAPVQLGNLLGPGQR